MDKEKLEQENTIPDGPTDARKFVEMGTRLIVATAAMKGVLSGIYSNKDVYDSISFRANTRGITIENYIVQLSLGQADELLKQEKL